MTLSIKQRRCLSSYILCVLAMLVLAIPSFSAEDLADTSAKDQVYPQVIVTATPLDPLNGSDALPPETLEALPNKDGNLNEALSVLPGIQLPDDYRQATKGGEILPPEISISGGRPYDNLIRVNGLSVSSPLDPASTDKLSADDLPSTASSLTLSKEIIDQVTVYRYNIPARFGGFSGGVIDATTRDSQNVVAGGMSYKTTRDEWSELFVNEEDKDDFYASRDASMQPHFVKHQMSLELETPLTDSSGLLGTYSLIRSEIPLIHFGDIKEQTRQSDNLLLKYNLDLSTETDLSITGIYTHYDEDTFRKDTFESDQTFSGEGLALVTELHNENTRSTFDLTAGLTYQEDAREGPESFYSWDITPSKPWGADFGTNNSKEGGYGDLSRRNLGIEIHPGVTFRTDTAETTQTTSVGLQYTWDHAEQERPEDAFLYYNAYDPINDSGDPTTIDCSLDPVGCIAGEQQFKNRWIYPEGKARVDVNQVGAYVEHQVQWQQLSLRPGLRYSTDDFQRNDNLAPRLAASYDLFNNGDTLLIAGANRYYSDTLLSYKLREYIAPTRLQSRSVTQPSAWPELDTYTELNTTLTHFSDLDTPYSDELAVAIDQGLLGGRLKLEFIRRDGQDEFSKEKTATLPDGHKYYELNNNGRSRHKEYVLSYERHATQWALLFNVTYQETASSNLSYDDLFDDETAEELVWYEGELIERWELPREEYNRPLTGNLVLTYNLPFGVTATGTVRYLGHYRELSKVDPDPADMPAEAVQAYKLVDRDDSWLTDLALTWEIARHQNRSLALTAEIYNLLNEKYHLTSPDSDYNLGRQFWGGFQYRF